MISDININQPIYFSSINNITITAKIGNSKDGDRTNYIGNDTLNNATILPGGKLSITNDVVANKTIAKSTADRASGKGAYFYVSGNAKSNNATIEENAYLNVGNVRQQEYKNGHWIYKPLSEQITKNKAAAINTHLLKGGVLWTGINSITKNTINDGGVLNEYYGSVSDSVNINKGREYTFSPVISSNSTFNHSYDYVGLKSKKGGIQNNVSAEKNSVINVTNDGTINNIKSIDSTINSNNKGTINNIDSQHSIINIENGGVISHITAIKNSIINNKNIIKNKNIITNSTLNMNTGSKADTVTLNNSLVNVNGTSTISNIISNEKSNTISFTKKMPVTLNSNTIIGNYIVKMSSNLNTFSSDLINVKHQIKGNLKLDFSGLGKTGRNTIGNGIKVINNESQSSSQHVTMTKPINRGMLIYNLKNINNDYYLQSSLNKINYINVYTPLALSNYSLSNTGSLYQRQGAFIFPDKNNVWVKYNSKKQQVNDGQLSSDTLTLGYTFYNNNNIQKHIDSGFMLNLGKLNFSYNSEVNNTDAISLYNYTTIKKQNYYFDFVNGFGLYKSKINPSISTDSESFDSKIFISSIETGYFFQYHNFNIIPQTQLIYQNYNQNSYNLVGYESDTKMDTVKQNNIIGRVGVNINRDIKKEYLYQPFIQLSVYNKFNKSHNITATDINVNQYANIKDDKTWLNITAGINIKVSPKSNIYADVIYDHHDINELIAYRYSF
ncbi:autotransporter domain-containing protein [Photobacterium sp. S4TG1]|uniref:autotransporter domain-containing protein n=1 Tax=Photobacterium sp. S4TG1 TaxID=3114587 RepID=UPI002E18641F|nr:autotransporter domain-containing protein [Photobacterium sp. S4TG1]